MIGLDLVFSLLCHFLRNRLTKWQTFTPCTTKKMAAIQGHSIASYFPSAFLLFFLDLCRKQNEELSVEAIPLLFTFYVLVSSASRVLLDTEMCQRHSLPILPQTDTFIFPSLRFSLPEIWSEGCLPRNRCRFWQECTGL